MSELLADLECGEIRGKIKGVGQRSVDATMDSYARRLLLFTIYYLRFTLTSQ